MKETRNCIICKFGKFKIKSTNNRKTCSTECSRIHKKQYLQRPDVREKIRQCNKRYRERHDIREYQKQYRQKLKIEKKQHLIEFVEGLK